MEFPHKPPTGYEYWTDDFKKTIKRIWIRNLGDFVYTGGEHPSSVWGFYDSRKKCYIAPINHKKPGKEVRIEDTTPYTAMQLNLNPLMRRTLDKMNIEPVYHVNLVYVKSKVPSFVLEELKQEAKNILESPNQFEKVNDDLAGNLEQEYQTSKGREILQPYLISLADEYFKCSEKHKQSQGCPH